MNGRYQQLVKEQADKIRAKIIGGYVYGEIITEDDIDAMLVAAYQAGITSESEHRTKRQERLFELFG